jgi:hypothetical protein
MGACSASTDNILRPRRTWLTSRSTIFPTGRSPLTHTPPIVLILASGVPDDFAITAGLLSLTLGSIPGRGLISKQLKSPTGKHQESTDFHSSWLASLTTT